MWQHQICVVAMLICPFLMAVSWLFGSAPSTQQQEKTEQEGREIQTVKVEPPDETWWREIFDYYD